MRTSFVIVVVGIAAAACGPSGETEPRRETATATESPRVEQSSPSETESLRAGFARLETEQRSLEKQLAALRAEIELQREELSRSEAARAENERPPPAPRAGDSPGTIRGVVQAVNNSVDIIIVSTGTRDGVTVGTEFAVVRAGETVATIVIDKTFPNYSSGSFKPFTPRTQIQSGDLCVGRPLTCVPK